MRTPGIGMNGTKDTEIRKRAPSAEHRVGNTAMIENKLTADTPIPQKTRTTAVLGRRAGSQGAVDADLKIYRGRRGRGEHGA